MLQRFSKVDGVMTTDQREMLNVIMRQEFRLNTTESIAAFKTVQEALHSNTTFIEAATLYSTNYAGDELYLNNAVFLLFALSHSGRDPRQEEIHAIEEVLTLFGFGKERFAEHHYRFQLLSTIKRTEAFERARLLQSREAIHYENQLKNSDIGSELSPIISLAIAALGAKPSASKEELKQAYRAKAKELHPDRINALGLSKQDEKLMTERFRELQEAYELLQSLGRVT